MIRYTVQLLADGKWVNLSSMIPLRSNADKFFNEWRPWNGKRKKRGKLRVVRWVGEVVRRSHAEG